MRKFSHFLNKLASFVLPHHCLLCHHATHTTIDLCRDCLTELPILTHSCPRCAQELSPEMHCPTCQSTPPPFHLTHALFSYRHTVTRLIMNLKFHAALIHAELLGQLFVKRIQEDWYKDKKMPDLIIPVPLHPKRQRTRGFNQALEIAKPISRLLNIPIEMAACQRVKYTTAQATLSAHARKQNIKDAFQIQGNLNHKHIALLDDVITTGQTIAELAHACRHAGAQQIDIWCCARAVKQS